MTAYKRYRKRGIVEARPYVPGEDLSANGVQVQASDTPRDGGFVAHTTVNQGAEWHIGPELFNAQYEAIDDACCCAPDTNMRSMAEHDMAVALLNE